MKYSVTGGAASLAVCLQTVGNTFAAPSARYRSSLSVRTEVTRLTVVKSGPSQNCERQIY